MTAPRRTKCRDARGVQKKHRPPPIPRKRGGNGGRPDTLSRDGGLAASVRVLRAEEPRPRIADHVAPLVEQRTTRPIATRTTYRIGRGVGGIGDVARLH